MADEPDNETPDTPAAPAGQPPEAEAPADQPVEASAAPTAEASEPEGSTTPEADQAPEADASAAKETPGADDTPEAESPAAEPAAEAPEATDTPEAADTPEVAETPEADARPEKAAASSEPAEEISSKERRRRTRSRHTGDARPARTPEERHAERLLERSAKAVRRRARRLQERAKAAERRATAAPSEPLAPVHAPVEGTRRVRQGVVVSDKAEKTITVRIDVARRHRRYEKIVRSSSTLHAHDENNDANEGDVVRVIESRPLSRTKRWKLVDVVERAR
jgi:small subunit ribosomal protein S17